MMPFNLNDITDNACYSITGLHYEQFHELLSKLTTLRNSPVRTKSDALSSFLSFTNAKQIENICNEVEEALVHDIIPFSLGANFSLGIS